MARSNDRERSSRRAPKEAARRGRKKFCVFCKEGAAWVDYKDVNLLRKFMSDRGKIRARRVSGNCAQHQRDVAVAIKTARELALLPYTQRTTNERPGGRGPGRSGRGGPGREAPGQPSPVVVADGAGSDGAGGGAGESEGFVEANLDVSDGAEAGSEGGDAVPAEEAMVEP
jgi:small subunit ribosomal protein S18